MSIQRTFMKQLEKTNMDTLPKIAFFGTPDIAVWVLEELEKAGIVPALIVTNPDAPQGRKMVLTPSPVSNWAEEKGIQVYKPESLKSDEVVAKLKESGCALFVVAAYGKIIPQPILDIPKYKTLNMHPSLLPQLRGMSPIRSAILEDIHPTGVSIMELTAGIDEGPVLAQEVATLETWPILGRNLDEHLARQGGALLSDVIPKWINGEIEAKEQNHSEATFSKKITKAMGELNLMDDPYQNYLKFCAFDVWPGTFFFQEINGKQIRVKITEAEYADGKFVVKKVIPEGKKEMDYESFIAQ